MTKTPQTLTEDLGQLAREEQDALLVGLSGDLGIEMELLAHGQLPPERVEALEQRARTDKRLAAALELYRPMPADTQGRFVAAARAGLKGASPAPAPPAEGPATGDELARRRRRRRFATVLSLASMAAAVGLFAVSRTRLPPIPAYELAVTGGESVVRGEPAAAGGQPLRLHADSEVDLVLHPTAALGTAPEVRAFAVLPDGSRRLLAIKPQVSPVGAVRISGPVDGVFGGLKANFTLIVVLQLPGARPPEPPVIGDASGPGWRQIAVQIQLVPSAPPGR